MVVATITGEFRKTKGLADRAIAQLTDDQLHARLDAEANSVAMLMAHMAGNMRSRWTDFLTTDGEKSWRTRDAEFDPPALARAELLASWEAGWQVLFDTLATLSDADLARTVTIRGEGQTALAAILRQVSHYGGHAHQIVLLAKHLTGAAWTVLSIPRGQSAAYTAASRAASGS
ncbi:MAG: DUF1572 family protein [Acidobacteria bacterium]|nr:DUF1572 family protein [Acidobacteriota bacterium]